VGEYSTRALRGHFCRLRLRAGSSVFVRPVRLSVCLSPSPASLSVSLSVLLDVCLLVRVVCLPMCVPLSTLAVSDVVLNAASVSACCLLGMQLQVRSPAII